MIRKPRPLFKFGSEPRNGQTMARLTSSKRWLPKNLRKARVRNGETTLRVYMQ